MYILARKIKASGFKVIMSGEGADEIFGGYLFFHKAPNAREFHRSPPPSPNTPSQLPSWAFQNCLSGWSASAAPCILRLSALLGSHGHSACRRI
jgi:Asparagine synthase